jgi:hypothetical protein
MIPLLNSEQIKIVKNQSFVRADRIKGSIVCIVESIMVMS